MTMINAGRGAPTGTVNPKPTSSSNSSSCSSMTILRAPAESSGCSITSFDASSADLLAVGRDNVDGECENESARKEDNTKKTARAEVKAVDGEVEAEFGIGTGGTADMSRNCVDLCTLSNKVRLKTMPEV